MKKNKEKKKFVYSTIRVSSRSLALYKLGKVDGFLLIFLSLRQDFPSVPYDCVEKRRLQENVICLSERLLIFGKCLLSFDEKKGTNKKSIKKVKKKKIKQ